MGVFTVAWGSHKWHFIHGLCHALDKYRKIIDEVATIEFLKRSKYRFPCIYCRRSYTGFLTQPRTNLDQPPLSYYEWSYYIHERVNMKLFWQAVKKQEWDRVWTYWYGYQPSVVDTTPPYIDTPKWWYHTFTFAYYMMCDYPKPEDEDMNERRSAIREFFVELGALLSSMSLITGIQLQLATQRVPLPASFDTDQESRLGYVRDLQCYMNTKGNLRIPILKEIHQICQRAIVGCDPQDQTKVGCY